MEIYSRIAGTGSYLPETILTNDELAQRVDTSDEWITDRVGIKRRHVIAEHETTSSMAHLASQAALQASGCHPQDIDLILVATCTPERMFPSTACLLQAHLGIERNITAFDVSAACAGFLYALEVADKFIKAGTVKTALVVGSEALTRMVDWTDRRTCVLFGDGAGAVVLQAAPTPGINCIQTYAQGAQQDILYLPNDKAAPALCSDNAYIVMQGREVFKFAVNAMGQAAETILADCRMNKSDIDWLVPHQANLRIIKSLAKKLDMPLEKVILTIEDQGNTSAASIPLALDAGIKRGQIQRGQNLLLEAIGGGMAWGSAIVTY